MKRIHSRRLFLGLAAGVLGTCAGCDLASLVYFLAPDATRPAEMKQLAAEEDKKKSPPKVIILTYMALETRREFIYADRQLAEQLSRNLTELADRNKEKIDIVPVRKVEDFKNMNPKWREMELSQIGREFKADHVIYLEINSLTMYEPGSANQLYRGRAQITVSLIDVSKPDESPLQKVYAATFPGEARGPMPADMHPTQFRAMFVEYLARKLSWYFSRVPHRDSHIME